MLDAQVLRVAASPGSKRLVVARAGREEHVDADAILVATGRRPALDRLGLESAGVAFDAHGIVVDDHLRTTNPRIYAAGDVASRFQFTHAADALARIALQNALFFGRKRASALHVPWCTYTDPEVAHVGLTSDEARARKGRVRTWTASLGDVDRAIVDRTTDGFARIHATRRGRILGATLVAPHAGESIGEMAIAVTARLRMKHLLRTIHPYPTVGEIWKKLGDEAFFAKVGPRSRSLAARFRAWRR